MKRISREEKNYLRNQLEDILRQYREINQQINEIKQNITEDEYLDFLRRLRVRNNETIQMLGRYMVRKCNRCI